MISEEVSEDFIATGLNYGLTATSRRYYAWFCADRPSQLWTRIKLAVIRESYGRLF